MTRISAQEERKPSIQESFLLQRCKCGHKRAVHDEEQNYECYMCDCQGFELR